jgi:transcriptional regulator with XRE-family HTH domain
MGHDIPIIGENLRRVRAEQQLSLSAVADQAGISVATLSRVETNKQSLDVSLLLTLARILDVPAAEILGEGDSSRDLKAVTRLLAELPASERTQVFLEASRRKESKHLGTAIDDLLSTIDMLREELLKVHRTVKRRQR